MKPINVVEHKKLEMSVDGCNVSLCFASEDSTAVVQTIKSILVQAYINGKATFAECRETVKT